MENTKTRHSFWELPIFKNVREPGSAFTHFLGMVMAIIAGIPLLHRTMSEHSSIHTFSMAVFIISMILLYAASTIYHTFDLSEKANCILKKCDHMMIFVMIAGSYTPICLIVLGDTGGFAMFMGIWIIAFAGMLLKAVWVYCPKWVSSIIYIAMGWTCIFSFSQIFHALHGATFNLLLAGGIIYTIGGIIYALKLPVFNNKYKNFGSHEIFHVFVMFGSLCHIIVMYRFVALM